MQLNNMKIVVRKTRLVKEHRGAMKRMESDMEDLLKHEGEPQEVQGALGQWLWDSRNSVG